MDESIVLVVPCYDEEESLDPFYEEIKRLRARMDIPLSLLFVNDGSNDGTLRAIQDIASNDPLAHYISFSRNFGKESALFAGLNKALELDSSYIALIDADLQDPPSLLADMYDLLLESSCDSVAAYRTTRHGERKVPSFFAHVFYRIMNQFSEVKLIEGARDYRIMTNRMARAAASLSERTRFSKGIFEWVGFDTRWIGYENIPRKNGKSKWSFGSLLTYGIEGLLSFSTTPLKIVSSLGLFMFFVSFVFLLFIFLRALFFGDPVPGWPSTICIITLLSGLQLLCSGLLGLYLANTYEESKKRPLYFIKEEG